MPRKNRKKGVSDSQLLAFHCLVSTTAASNSVAVSVSPSGLAAFSTRLVTAAEQWTKFRVLSLKFRSHPTATALSVGYTSGIQDANTFSGNIALMEMIPAAFQAAVRVDPTEYVRVQKIDLVGPLPWYKSLTGGADATEEAPGQLVVRTAGASDAVLIELRGVMEFAGSVPPANTPEELALVRKLFQLRRDRALAAERAAAFRLFSTGVSSAATK